MQVYLDRFEAFECFHGCRIETPAPYFDEGFLLHDEKELRKRGAKVLGVKPSQIDSVCKAGADIDEGKVFFVLDEQHLLKCCGHYLIYGSERITGYAVSLTRSVGSDLRQRLKSVGNPTVFQVHLPREHIPKGVLEDLAENIPVVTWEDFSGAQDAPRFDWTFIQKESVPPSCIVGHTCPTRIHDPLHWGTYYSHQPIA